MLVARTPVQFPLFDGRDVVNRREAHAFLMNGAQ